MDLLSAQAAAAAVHCARLIRRIGLLLAVAAMITAAQTPADKTGQDVRDFAATVFRAMRTAGPETLRSFTVGPASYETVRQLAKDRALMSGNSDEPLSEKSRPIWSIISVDVESPIRATLSARLIRAGSLPLPSDTSGYLDWLLIKTPDGWRIAIAN